MATIGELNIKLSLDSGTYQADLLKSTQATQKATESMAKSFNKLAQSTAKTGKGFGRTAKATQQMDEANKFAQISLLNTGRALEDGAFFAQDFRFGLIAISNNLTPLIEGLTATNKAAKAANTTIGTALLGSLKGAGGLIFAVQAVSAVLTAGTIIWDKYRKKVEDTKEEIEEVTTRLANLPRVGGLGLTEEEFTAVIGRETEKLKLLNKELDDNNDFLDQSVVGTEKWERALARARVSDLTEEIKLQKSVVDGLNNEYEVYKRSIEALDGLNAMLGGTIAQTDADLAAFIRTVESLDVPDPAKWVAAFVSNLENMEVKLPTVIDLLDTLYDLNKERLNLPDRDFVEGIGGPGQGFIPRSEDLKSVKTDVRELSNEMLLFSDILANNVLNNVDAFSFRMGEILFTFESLPQLVKDFGSVFVDTFKDILAQLTETTVKMLVLQGIFAAFTGFGLPTQTGSFLGNIFQSLFPGGKSPFDVFGLFKGVSASTTAARDLAISTTQGGLALGRYGLG